MFTKRENEDTAMFILRMAARLLSIAFILLMVLYYVGDRSVGGETSSDEYIGMLFFPFGMCIGFIIGWRHELVGGLVACVSMLLFYVVYGLLLTGSVPHSTWFIIFDIPGLLFLIYGILRPPQLHVTTKRTV
jgi:hypothetical protein